jgi:hypothetical protein
MFWFINNFIFGRVAIINDYRIINLIAGDRRRYYIFVSMMKQIVMCTLFF